MANNMSMLAPDSVFVLFVPAFIEYEANAFVGTKRCFGNMLSDPLAKISVFARGKRPCFPIDENGIYVRVARHLCMNPGSICYATICSHWNVAFYIQIRAGPFQRNEAMLSEILFSLIQTRSWFIYHNDVPSLATFLFCSIFFFIHTMKKITFSIDLLVALAQLEDKDLAQVQRAIISYASEGTAPTFTNVALKAFFSLFRSSIDEQRTSADKQSKTNSENAKARKSPPKKKEPKPAAVSSEPQPVATTPSEPLTLEAIEAVYPKLGSFRDESLMLWGNMSDDVRKRAVAFAADYVKLHPSSADQLYLNQYLKAAPWNS